MFHFYVTMPFNNFYIDNYNSNILEFLILEKDATFCPDSGQNIKKVSVVLSSSNCLWHYQHLYMGKANLFSSSLVSSSRELWNEWGGHERYIFIELSSKLSWACDSSAQDRLALKRVRRTAGLLSIWSTVSWHLTSRDIENTTCWMWFPMIHVTVGLFTQLPALKFLPPQIPSPPKKSEGS